MSTIKTGTTTTTGLIVEADTSGNLVVQTGSTPTTALTISGTNQQMTLAAPLVNPVPAFRAILSVDQSVSSGVTTRVQLDSVVFDTNSWFDNVTNYRYTPQIAGYYFFNGVVRFAGTNITRYLILIGKNGSTLCQGDTINPATSSAAQHMCVSSLGYMNGTTDYVDLSGQVTATSPTFDYANDGATCIFEGFLVRAA